MRSGTPRNAGAGPRRRPRWRARLLGLFGGTTFAVVAAELGLRWWNEVQHPAMYALHDRLGWIGAAGVDRMLTDENGRRIRFALDADGVRTAAPPLVAPGSAGRRVLFVGDSFTQGAQVEAAELFTSRVAETLDDVAVCNAGVGGYSTLQELLLLEQRLPSFGPAVVVLVVFDNDFRDNLMPYFSGLGPRPYVTVANATVSVHAPDDEAFRPFLLPVPARTWLFRHSAICRSLHKNLFLPLCGKALAAREQREQDALPLGDQRAAMAFLLARVAETVRSAGSKLLVAAIPARQAVAHGVDPQHPWLADRCNELGVSFLSLLPALVEVGAGRAYFATDIHLTAVGHARVAEALVPAIAPLLR